MLFWALLASGQINMRKVDGWQTLATPPIAQPIELAARNYNFMLPGERPHQIPTTFRTAPPPYMSFHLQNSRVKR
jgi:hypothetical protein